MAEGSGPLLILLQLNFLPPMSDKKSQTVDVVVARMTAMMNTVEGIRNNFNNVIEDLSGLEVLPSQKTFIDQAIVEARTGVEACNGMTNYYTAQLNNLIQLQNQAIEKAAQTLQELPQPVQEQPSQLPEMTDTHTPRPGSPAWRILQRTNPELAKQLTTFNPEAVAAEVETQPAAPAAAQKVDGPYDREVPSYAAKPETAPAAAPETTTRRSTVTRPTRPVSLQQAPATAAPVADIGSLPAVVAPAPSKLPDPVPREPQALPTLMTPPNGYQRLTIPKYSPLIRAFAPAPWLEDGTGAITVGTKNWPEIQENIYDKNGYEMVVSSQGFYRNQGDEFPSSVLIRMRTFAVLWNFGTAPGDILVYQVGLSDAGTNDHRWFPAHTLPSSATLRLLGELHTYLGVAEVAFNPAVG